MHYFILALGLTFLAVVLTLFFLRALLSPIFTPPPTSLTTSNTSHNTHENGGTGTNMRKERRRRGLRHREWSEDEDGLEKPEEAGSAPPPPIFRLVQSRPPPEGIKGCLKRTGRKASEAAGGTESDSTTATTGEDEAPLPLRGPLSQHTGTSKQVRLVEPSKASLEALRDFWATTGDSGAAGGIAGYRRTREIYAKGQAGSVAVTITGADDDRERLDERAGEPRVRGRASGLSAGGEDSSADEEDLTGEGPSPASTTSTPRRHSPRLHSPSSGPRVSTPSPCVVAAGTTRRRGARKSSLSPNGGRANGDSSTGRASSGASAGAEAGLARTVPRWIKVKPERSTPVFTTRGEGGIVAVDLGAGTGTASGAVTGDSDFEDVSEGSGASTPTASSPRGLTFTNIFPLSPVVAVQPPATSAFPPPPPPSPRTATPPPPVLLPYTHRAPRNSSLTGAPPASSAGTIPRARSPLPSTPPAPSPSSTKPPLVLRSTSPPASAPAPSSPGRRMSLTAKDDRKGGGMKMAGHGVFGAAPVPGSLVLTGV